MNELQENNEYFAHSENDVGKKHYLKDHLFKTAKISESFSLNETNKKFLKIAGLLHDFGKYQPNFQLYLENGGKRGCVPHSAWGAGYARKLKQLEISIAIDGHHKGIPNPEDWRNDTNEFVNGNNSEFKKIIDIFHSDNQLDAKFLELEKTSIADGFIRESFIRYLFSALTDADWLDTEAHFKPEDTYERKIKELPVDAMIEKLDNAIMNKPKDGEINSLRNQVRQEVLKKANVPPGFYSLNLPTGMGKTLISLSWALRHAKENSLKRIIIVLPYINIIDQTAKILKEIFGDEWILEHHSGFNDNIFNNEMIIEGKEKYKQLACENWDFPVIITTTVQFFESLFSNKPSRCRRVHNIAEAVVIFDEVQSLPKKILLPTLTMLDNIQKLMRTTFLFCTATMPAFEKRDGFEGLERIEPLFDHPEYIYNKTIQRVSYTFFNELQPVAMDTVAHHVCTEKDSVLCIFNTKKAARDFFKLMSTQENTWANIYHLSTGMCPVHRKEIINNIIASLQAKRKVFVSSTQLIEAGVDFDFPCVLREIAPLESIIQAAGRCNREGKMVDKGKVFLFRLMDGGMPDQAYKTYAEFAVDMIQDDLNRLYRYDFFNDYYKKIISLFTDPDKNKINDARKKLEFKTVNDSYHVIDKQTESLFVYRYNEESMTLFKSIEHKPFLSRDDYRKMQMYSVPVFKNFLIKCGHFCKDMSQGFVIWNGSYDKNTGISTELMSPDECIV